MCRAPGGAGYMADARGRFPSDPLDSAQLWTTELSLPRVSPLTLFPLSAPV